MYYSYAKESLEKGNTVELLYLGEKFLLSPQKKGIATTNCRTGEKALFESFQELCSNEIFFSALHEENYSKVWASLESNRLCATEDEFVSNLNLGCEIEFIFRGIGFFVCQQMGTDRRIWQLHNAYLHESQYFCSPNELWENACLLDCPLKDCINEVEIMAYM